ncbi:MAG TPA: hypothetical protein VN884_01175 [Candidatus Sulfotelmatobacter sp.]|jgi:hypothetical protein|nr:hypothetical protein [Candidatus Sulfotelmatobacter sp.]
MTWTDQLGNLLKQYTTSGGAAAQPAPDVHAHFDQVAQAAPASAIAEGLSAAFKSDKTPAFGQMLTTLFNNSSGDQKAGMINQLLSSVNPDTLKQVLGGAGLAGILGGAGTQVTPDQAQKLSPEVVQQLATHAEKTNPSVVDSVSTFYSQHSTLIKTLGGTALTVALAKVAERQKQA